MVIAVVDIGSGNLRSMTKALATVSDHPVVRVTSAAALSRASHIVLPGQGEFATCMNNLAALPDMHATLVHMVRTQQRPFLGVCVGMQMLADEGQETGSYAGLGWLGGVSRYMQGAQDAGLTLPHMGWNQVHFARPHPLSADLGAAAWMYFANSYHYCPRDAAAITASYCHGERFAAMVCADNIVGVQFHPEKSQRAGLSLLRAFCRWRP